MFATAAVQDSRGTGDGEGGVAVRLSGGEVLKASFLVGTDGAKSVVAQHLGLGKATYAGYTAFR